MIAGEYVPLGRASHLFPGHPTAQTIARWALSGVRPRRGGQRVRLEVTKVGGRIFVSPEAIRDFVDAVNGRDVPIMTVSADDVARRGREAARALESVGA